MSRIGGCNGTRSVGGVAVTMRYETHTEALVVLAWQAWRSRASLRAVAAAPVLSLVNRKCSAAQCSTPSTHFCSSLETALQLPLVSL